VVIPRYPVNGYKTPLSETLYPLRCYHRQRTIRSSNHYFYNKGFALIRLCFLSQDLR